MKRSRMTSGARINAGLCVGLAIGAITAGAAGASEPQATPPSAAGDDTRPGKPSLPSLDELLGIQDQPRGGEQGAAQDANDAALERVLNPQEAGRAFSQAVSLMDQVASRMRGGGDLSLTTQRLQDDIIRKLDMVIASAEQNQSGSSSSSSSSSSSGKSDESQPDQQQKPQGQSGSPGDAKESGDAPMPSGSSQTDPGDAVAPTGVSWGALPQRVREALSQGISDEYSRLYRAMTEEYYKSLAEDQQ